MSKVLDDQFQVALVINKPYRLNTFIVKYYRWERTNSSTFCMHHTVFFLVSIYALTRCWQIMQRSASWIFLCTDCMLKCCRFCRKSPQSLCWYLKFLWEYWLGILGSWQSWAMRFSDEEITKKSKIILFPWMLSTILMLAHND